MKPNREEINMQAEDPGVMQTGKMFLVHKRNNKIPGQQGIMGKWRRRHQAGAHVVRSYYPSFTVFSQAIHTLASLKNANMWLKFNN